MAVNTAWFSSRLHVESWKQPDLQWLGVDMAMSLFLLSCLHVTLIFHLLHGEFYGFCCEIFKLGVSLHLLLKDELTKSHNDMTFGCSVWRLAGCLWEKLIFFSHYVWDFWPDFLHSRWLLSDGNKPLWFNLCWWESSLLLRWNMVHSYW